MTRIPRIPSIRSALMQLERRMRRYETDTSIVRYEITNRRPWLYVIADTARPPNNSAIMLQSLGTGLASQVTLASSAAGSRFVNVSEDAVQTRAPFIHFTLDSGGPGWLIQRPTDNRVLLRVRNDSSVEFKLDAGEEVLIVDSADAPIFRVDEDGSVHIRTGTAIIADL